jgi:hypothetical protein
LQFTRSSFSTVGPEVGSRSPAQAYGIVDLVGDGLRALA